MLRNGQALQYDADGNLTNDGANHYSWDAANRLIQIAQLHPITGTEAHTSQFTYDGAGRRVEDKELQGVKLVADRKFIYVGAGMAEERDQHNNVIKRFYGGGVQDLSGAQTGNYSYLRDHLGSVRSVLDANGNVVSLVDYDLWGNLTQTSGTFTPDFGYSGYFEHQPSGLNLTWFRGYSPLLGRWISRDPIGISGGSNLYQYVGNDGLEFVDTFGLCCNGNLCQQLLNQLPGNMPANFSWQGSQVFGLSAPVIGPMAYYFGFKNGGFMDYANGTRGSSGDNTPQAQNLHRWGNINFGFVNNASGLSKNEARWLAGLARQNGGSHPDEGQGNLSTPPYGNIPAADQDVMLGWEIYDNCFK